MPAYNGDAEEVARQAIEDLEDEIRQLNDELDSARERIAEQERLIEELESMGPGNGEGA